jgi:hypothetical protein
VPVVRLLTISAGSLTVREFHLGTLKAALPAGARLRASAATATFEVEQPEIAGAWGSDSVLRYFAHPFYWNADGSEAMAIAVFTALYFPFPGNPTVFALEGTVLLKLTATAAGYAMTLMEISGVAESDLFTPAPRTGDQFNYSYSDSRNYSGVQNYPLAADYLGNTPRILRAKVTETLVEGHTITHATTGYPLTSDPPGDFRFGPWSINYRTAHTLAASAQSGVTLNDAPASGLDSTCTRNSSTVLRTAAAIDASNDSVGDSTLSSESGIEQSGKASKWAVAGGDLRGTKIVLRESPWYFVRRAFAGNFQSMWVQMTSATSRHEGVSYGTGTTFTEVGGFFAVVDLNTLAHEPLGDLTHPINYGLFVTIAGSGSLASGSGTPFQTYTARDGTSGTGPFQGLGDSELDYEQSSIPSRVWLRPAGLQSVSPGNTFFTGAGGYCDVAFSSGAVSPDGKIQYIGLLSVALAPPDSPDTAPLVVLDRWYANGTGFTPTEPYPHTGSYKMLSSPVFVGPLPKVPP